MEGMVKSGVTLQSNMTKFVANLVGWSVGVVVRVRGVLGSRRRAATIATATIVVGATTASSVTPISSSSFLVTISTSTIVSRWFKGGSAPGSMRETTLMNKQELIELQRRYWFNRK